MPRKSAAQKRKNNLLDEEDEVDVNAEWTVNENYAKRFTHNKQREDLHRLQELKKKGMAGSDSDDSESEDEDEDGKLPVKTDVQIFETLAMIKKKDPTIYKPEAKFYDDDEDDDEEEEENTVYSKKKKPLYLKDVQARHLLDGDDDDEEDIRKKKQPKVKTYADEQEELKRSFLRSVEEADDSDDDLLRVRHRTNEELAKDEKETAEAVQEAERRKKDQDISKKLEDYFGKKDDDLDENEKFLKEFFLNEGWIDKERNRVASLRDIIGEVSEDEAHLEDQDKYEAEYNFRFQENAGAQVMANPRVVDGTVRKKGEVRKTQRQKKAERLAEEKKAREEELKRLKNLKKKEIVEKLEKIKTVAGATAGLASLVEDDLEEDFDPLEYDRKMQEAFGESYYQEEDAEIGNEVDDEGIIEKPNFDEEDEELGLPKDWDKKAGGFAAAHKTQKVSFKDKIAVDKNLEEYYKLDYEDMIGDLPTRFKYRGVKPNTFGLDVADILTADDKELNQHVSIKKLAPYRGEEWEAPKYSVLSQKARKKQALQDGPSQAPRKFSKGKLDEKKKKGKNKDKVPADESNVKKEKDEAQNVDSLEAEGEKKSKKRKRKMKKKEGPYSFLPPSRVGAYGALPTPGKKKKRKSVAG